MATRTIYKFKIFYISEQTKEFELTGQRFQDKKHYKIKLNLIGIINYGSGNFQSVCNAIEHLGFKFKSVSSFKEFNDLDHLILPGVGSYQETMKCLQSLNLINPIKEFVTERKLPFLGICVGKQILSTFGTEFNVTEGLNLIPGKSVKIDSKKNKLVLPHIGWNEICIVKSSPLYKSLPEKTCFYFVHSYHLVPNSEDVISSYCEYGVKITASVEKENVFGVQFHPEKSQLAGLTLLKNFCKF